jgi:hypothetical protein
MSAVASPWRLHSGDRLRLRPVTSPRLPPLTFIIVRLVRQSAQPPTPPVAHYRCIIVNVYSQSLHVAQYGPFNKMEHEINKHLLAVCQCSWNRGIGEDQFFRFSISCDDRTSERARATRRETPVVSSSIFSNVLTRRDNHTLCRPR